MVSLPLVTAAAGNRSLSGKLTLFNYPFSRLSLTIRRGINEGRQAARDVDVYLMGVGTLLPKTGGIISRAPYDIIGKPDLMKAQAVGA